MLKAHRWCSDAEAAGARRPLTEGNALFGIGCAVLSAGAVIAIGDDVDVHSSGGPIIPAPA